MLSGVFPELNPASEATLQLLFLLAGFAALMFGCIGRMLKPPHAAEDGAESLGSAVQSSGDPDSASRPRASVRRPVRARLVRCRKAAVGVV